MYPAIALAQELTDCQSIFLGSSDRIDGDIIRKNGYPFYGIGPSRRPFWAILRGTISAIRHFRRIRPRVVICTGGMITLPVAMAAKLCRIPLVVLEQNSIAGRTNRLIAIAAKLVITAFPKTQGLRSGVPLGNPVRKRFLHDSWIDDLIPILEMQSTVVLVFGGSQGAKALNEIVKNGIPAFAAKHWFLVHILGENEYKNMGYSGPIQSIVTPSEKVVGVMVPYAESMDVLYRYASVVVSRAGATSIAELLEFRSKSVLIPYPYAKDDHQTSNAMALANSHRSIVVPERELSLNRLMAAIELAAELRPADSVSGARERIAGMIRKLFK